MSEKKSTISQRFLLIGNTIFHQFVAVVGVFILWTLCYSFENNLSRWHMILTTLAYIPLMAEAIVLFASENVWTQKIPRSTRYNIHGCMLFISAILATIGIAFMISRKTTHFNSTHGWSGFVSWIFVLLSQVLGIFSAKSQSLKNILKPVWFKLIHNIFGMLGYLFGLVSICYALDKRSISLQTGEESRTATVVLISIIAFWSVLAALKSAYNQIKTILS